MILPVRYISDVVAAAALVIVNDAVILSRLMLFFYDWLGALQGIGGPLLVLQLNHLCMLCHLLVVL
jgi:hypothetical protein